MIDLSSIIKTSTSLHAGKSKDLLLKVQMIILTGQQFLMIMQVVQMPMNLIQAGVLEYQQIGMTMKRVRVIVTGDSL